jgi:hypothetical protein
MVWSASGGGPHGPHPLSAMVLPRGGPRAPEHGNGARRKADDADGHYPDTAHFARMYFFVYHFEKYSHVI